MKYLKDACGLSAFSDQVIIIIIIAIIIIAIIFIIIIIIAIIFVIAIMLRFQEILNALGLFEMFGVGLQNGQKKMIQMMTMIAM